MDIVHADIHDCVKNLFIRRRHTRSSTHVQTKVSVHVVTSGVYIQNIHINIILCNTYRDVDVYEAPHDGHRNIEVVNSRHQSGLYGMLQVQDIPFVTSPCMVICMTWFNNGQRWLIRTYFAKEHNMQHAYLIVYHTHSIYLCRRRR